jgi:hypothetical protein
MTRSSPGIESALDRIEQRLNESGVGTMGLVDTIHAAAALVREARASLQPATPTAGDGPCHDCGKREACDDNCPNATASDAVAGEAKAAEDVAEMHYNRVRDRTTKLHGEPIMPLWQNAKSSVRQNQIDDAAAIIAILRPPDVAAAPSSPDVERVAEAIRTSEAYWWNRSDEPDDGLAETLARAAIAAMNSVARSEGIQWRRVNDEPFEYAIQQGPHGDEFVKLISGSCLRRSIDVAQAVAARAPASEGSGYSMREALNTACLRLQSFLDTVGDIGGCKTQADLNDWIGTSDAPAQAVPVPALVEFFKWAMREGPWEGGDLDGGGIQDKAESLGLIVKTKFDPEKHSTAYGDFPDGDDYYEFAPGVSITSTDQAGGK